VADDNKNGTPDALESNVNTMTGLSTLPEAEVNKAMTSFQAEQPRPDSIALPQDQLQAFQDQILGGGTPVEEDFDVLDPAGKLGKVSGRDLKEVLESGAARLVSSEEKQNLTDELQYGEKQAQAALLGAARGLTFGASDQLLEGSGAYEADELRGIENANFGSSIAGEIGGAVLPAFFSGGTSAVATGAKFAGAGLRAAESIAAKAATKATQSLIKQGVSKSAARAIAQKMLPEIVDLGVQGAAQGIGRLVTEDAFGTADFNAQNLIAYAGMGSLVGGTFGTALGMGKAIAPSVKAVTGKLGDKVDSGLGKLFNREDSALELSGLSVMDTVKAEAQNPKFRVELANEVEDILKFKKPKNYEEFYDAVSKRREEAGQAIGSIYKEADEILTSRGIKFDSPPLSTNIMKSVDDYVDSLGDVVKADGTAENLRKFGTSYAELVAKRPQITVSQLQDEAKKLQDRIYKGSSFGTTLAEGTMADLQDVILKQVRSFQKDMVKEADKLKFGQLSQELERYNKSFQILKSVNRASDKAAEKLSRKSLLDRALETKSLVAAAVDPSLGAAVVGTRLAMESFAVQKATVMGKLQVAQMRTMANINKIANNVGNFTTKVAGAADDAAFRHITSFELSKDANGRKPKDEQAAYQNIRENLANMASDPQSVLRKANQSTAAIFDHAPETAAQVDATYLAAMMFLNKKTKKSSKKKGAFDFGSADPVPTIEIGKMQRYLEAIEDPNSVLKKASKGKISREGVEVLKNIYPQIFKTLQLKTLDKIHKNQTKLSYQDKLNLGLLLDVKAHESMDYEQIQSLQAVIGSDSGAPGQESGPGYSPNNAQSLEKSSRYETVTQESGEV
jgi:hypothetical protein